MVLNRCKFCFFIFINYIIILSEIDNFRNEVRKIEIYKNGLIDYTDKNTK